MLATKLQWEANGGAGTPAVLSMDLIDLWTRCAAAAAAAPVDVLTLLPKNALAEIGFGCDDEGGDGGAGAAVVMMEKERRSDEKNSHTFPPFSSETRA